MSVFSFLFSTWDADEASGRGGGVRWCAALPREWSWRILAAVLCCHFCVFLFFNLHAHEGSSRVRNPAPLYFCKCSLFSFWCFPFFFKYTPMEVVSPVGMLIHTAVYTLAADGAVFDTPKKN